MNLNNLYDKFLQFTDSWTYLILCTIISLIVIIYGGYKLAQPL